MHTVTREASTANTCGNPAAAKCVLLDESRDAKKRRAPRRVSVGGEVTTSTPKLYIIVASTRPGRIGLPVATWFREQAHAHGGFEVEWVDLAEWNLPFFDEPHHPRLRRYTREHTLRWSTLIDAADVFVIVTPEYNHGFTAPLKNAIDYLHYEWAYKPVGLVSYGGVSGGTRAVQLLKPVLSDLKMVPAFEGVNIAFVGQYIKDGVFAPPEPLAQSAQIMLAELERTEQALRSLRQITRQETPAAH
jgi:NAD(P)H-dependent FMN reductase